MSNQAALDTDRKVLVIVPPGYTMRDGIIYSDGGADCLQAPEHRGGSKLVEISRAENAKYVQAHFAHQEARALWRADLDAGNAAAKDEPAPPVRYLSEAGNIVQTRPKITRATR